VSATTRHLAARIACPDDQRTTPAKRQHTSTTSQRTTEQSDSR
jgi:hypothetical protein